MNSVNQSRDIEELEDMACHEGTPRLQGQTYGCVEWFVCCHITIVLESMIFLPNVTYGQQQ